MTPVRRRIVRSASSWTISAVDLGAIAITGLLGATTILKALSVRPAHLLREP